MYILSGLWLSQVEHRTLNPAVEGSNPSRPAILISTKLYSWNIPSVMNVLVQRPSKLKGEVTVPGSKSYTHRVLVAASLGTHTRIQNPSNSSANTAMVDACIQLGAKIKKIGSDYDVTGFDGLPVLSSEVINLGNSGTALRLFTSLATLSQGSVTITGDDSLQNRPLQPLVLALNKIGADIQSTQGHAPLKINARGLEGGHAELNATQSSQYVSSILMASPFAKNDITLDVTGTLVSRPYIDMTMEVLERFNIAIQNENYRRYMIKSGQKYSSPETYRIPGDYSQAAFFLAAASLIESDVIIRGLIKDDMQGDKRIVDILQQMGADITYRDDSVRVCGPAKLHGDRFDLIDSPDLFPVLAVLGACAEGTMTLYNMPQIRTKETDRIAVMSRELQKIGVGVSEGETEMTVHGTAIPEKDYELDARGHQGVSDHRIAMALSLIGVYSGRATITDADSVRISYPDYFADLESLGVRISRLP